MEELLQEWNMQFDHVIIDSPPVVLASDAVRLSVAADSVILVVRRDHTPQEAFARAQELLTQVSAPVIGVVFNGADLNSSELSYYGQYGYHSSSQPN
jgi:Mrp family chromosome partitioning ATPase